MFWPTTKSPSSASIFTGVFDDVEGITTEKADLALLPTLAPLAGNNMCEFGKGSDEDLALIWLFRVDGDTILMKFFLFGDSGLAIDATGSV